MHKLLKTAIFLSYLTLSAMAIAAPAPVEDGTQGQNVQYNNDASQAEYNNVAANSSAPLTLDQRVAKLENQMQNTQQQDLQGQIQTLQQAIQSLRGRIEVQAHEIKMLTAKTATKADKHTAAKMPVKNNAITQAQKQQANNQVQTAANQAAKGSNFLSDQNSYEKAYNAIKNRQFEQAQVAMESYLKNHPQGHYISNAHYWLGELYLLKNQTQKALTQFQVVANRYPQSPKIPDALLKIGFVYYDIGQFVKAKQQLLQVTQKYPNTTVAQLANNRLRMIAQLNQNDVQKQNPNANTQNH